MRCPECTTVCSELRDLCPRCLADLRSFKKDEGLPVMHEQASYDDLVAKYARPAKPSAISPRPRIFGLFWGKQEEDAGAPTPTAAKGVTPPSPPKSAPPSGMMPPKPPAPPEQPPVTTRVASEIPSAPPVSAPPIEAPPRFPASVELPAPQPRSPASIETPAAPRSTAQAVEAQPPITMSVETSAPQPPPPASFETPPASRSAHPAIEAPVIEAPPLFTTTVETSAPTLSSPTSIETLPDPFTARASAAPVETVEDVLIEVELESDQETANEEVSAGPKAWTLDMSAETEDLEQMIEQFVEEPEASITEPRSAEMIAAGPVAEAEAPFAASEAHSADQTVSQQAAAPAPEARDGDELQWMLELERKDIATQTEDSIVHLFDSALRELIVYDDPDSFEIELVQLASLHSEKTELLFDLADEEVVDPEAAKRYAERVIESDQRKVEAEALAKQLAKVEHVINAPLPALGALQREAPAGESELPTSIVVDLLPASAGRRIGAWMLDLCFSLAIGLFPLVMFLLGSDSMLRQTVLVGSFDRLAVLKLLLVLVPSSLLTVLIVPLVTLLLTNHTFGARMMGVQLRAETGKPPSVGNILVRSFATPLSFALLGVVPAIFGRRTLHDVLARTRLVRVARHA